jgi:hypothetical protein
MKVAREARDIDYLLTTSVILRAVTIYFDCKSEGGLHMAHAAVILLIVV